LYIGVSKGFGELMAQYYFWNKFGIESAWCDLAVFFAKAD